MFTLDKWRRQTFGDELTLQGEIIAAQANALLVALTDFLKANNLKTDWAGIESAPNEALVNALAMMSPFGPNEKQALLEAKTLAARADVLVAITEIELARGNGSSTNLQ